MSLPTSTPSKALLPSISAVLELDSDGNHFKLTATKKAPSPPPATWRPKFTLEDDLIIWREVYASRDHIAPYDEAQKQYSQAEEKAIQNKHNFMKIVAKSSYRYKKIQAAHD